VNRPFLVMCLAAACVAGAAFGHAISKAVPLRDALGVLCGRGKLLASIDGRGIYEEDVLRAQREMSYVSGAALPSELDQQILPSLIANLSIRRQAPKESVSPARTDSEYRVLRSQLRDEATWEAMLSANHFSPETFRAEIAKNLRAGVAIERRLVPIIKISAGQTREYYDANAADCSLPPRFRARHIFFAAPRETPLEVVDAKRRAADVTATRLAHGEDFAELAALVSEDEATKARGGDLVFFSKYRMPPDFISEVTSIRVGETGGIVRTTLGFHILELIEARPSRQMGYDEVAGEIKLTLENGKRRGGCAEVAHELTQGVDVSRFSVHPD
jgi:parvulin-like peptidyl-prolyl isomerase